MPADTKIGTLAERETEFSFYSISSDGEMVWLDMGLFTMAVSKQDFELWVSALDQIFTVGARGVVMEGETLMITITPSDAEEEDKKETDVPNHYHVILSDGIHDLSFVIQTKEFPMFLHLVKTAREKLALQPNVANTGISQ